MSLHNLVIHGDYAKVLKALSDNLISLPNYVFIDDKRQLAYIDEKKNVFPIFGDNIYTSEPDETTLDNAMEGTIFVYGGKSYYKNSDGELELLDSGIHNQVQELLPKVAQIEVDLNNKLDSTGGTITGNLTVQGDTELTSLNGSVVPQNPVFTDTTYDVVDYTADGLMSSEDKEKFDDIYSAVVDNDGYHDYYVQELIYDTGDKDFDLEGTMKANLVQAFY